jgi:pyridinium-3,5-biscarboxylic acid mononucleotide sulfurtransferase
MKVLLRVQRNFSNHVRKRCMSMITTTQQLSHQSSSTDASCPVVTATSTANPSGRIVSVERDTATTLVDQLFQRTHQLMYSNYPEVDGNSNSNSNSNTTANRQQPQPQFCHTVAFSGGIDSSLVAAVVYKLGLDLNSDAAATTTAITTSSSTTTLSHHTVRAVLGISPSVSMEQIGQAQDVAAHIGIPLIQIPTYEGSNELYVANTGQACRACKTELYTKLIHCTISNYQHHHQQQQHQHQQQHIESEKTDTPSTMHYKLYNGTNADDCLDPTRVGLIAASEYNVLSPLRNSTKEEVRIMARHLQLPNWNVASNPCLRSRLSLGIPATREHLHRIEVAERYVRQQLHHVITVETNLRVRLLAQQRACIEIDDILVEDVTNLYHTHQWEWHQVLLQELQFNSVTIRAFRSGSVATPTASV